MTKSDKEPKLRGAANFACVPSRAFCDRRLALCDLRVLGAIASHDRLGKNGMGCYASRTQLARESACVKSVVTRSRKKLIRLGYVREENRGSRRRLQYFVVHDTAGAQADMSGQNDMQKSDSPQSFSASKKVQKSDRSATPQMQKSDRSATHNIYSEAPHPKSANAGAPEGPPDSLPYGQSSWGGASSLRSSSEEIPQSCRGTLREPPPSLKSLRKKAEEGSLTAEDMPTDIGVLRGYAAQMDRYTHRTPADLILLNAIVDAAEIDGEMDDIGHIERVISEFEYALRNDGEFESPVEPTSRRQSKHPIPPDFVPDEACRRKASALGMDLDHELDVFTEHASANGRRLVDWQAGFRQWLATASKLNPPKAPKNTLPAYAEESHWRELIGHSGPKVDRFTTIPPGEYD